MVHLLGSTGYIGSKISNFFMFNNLPFISYSSKISAGQEIFDLDIIDVNQLNKVKKGDIVLFLSAISSPDICESNYELAKKINLYSTSFYIKEIIKREAYILFVSSDVVYGNNAFVNDELSPLNPFGNYAKLKYLIENEFLHSKYFKTLRLSYVFSKFDSFFLYLKKSLIENNIATVFSGLRRNIIYIDDVILSINLIILGIIEDDFMIKDLKTLNLVGKENLSRSEMALIFNKRFSLLKVNIIKTPTNYLTNRPDSIYTKSLFLDKIIKKELVTYSHFINNLGEEL